MAEIRCSNCGSVEFLEGPSGGTSTVVECYRCESSFRFDGDSKLTPDPENNGRQNLEYFDQRLKDSSAKED